jgi:hypothetical protein
MDWKQLFYSIVSSSGMQGPAQSQEAARACGVDEDERAEGLGLGNIGSQAALLPAVPLLQPEAGCGSPLRQPHLSSPLWGTTRFLLRRCAVRKAKSVNMCNLLEECGRYVLVVYLSFTGRVKEYDIAFPLWTNCIVQTLHLPFYFTVGSQSWVGLHSCGCLLPRGTDVSTYIYIRILSFVAIC